MSGSPSKLSLKSLKSFIIKQKSLSKLPSKQLSVVDFSDQQRQKPQLIQTQRLPLRINDQTQLERKNDEITLLKRKLDTAMSMAISERLLIGSNRQQVFKDQKTKAWFQGKIQQLQKTILKERQQFAVFKHQVKDLETKSEQITSSLKQKQQQCRNLLEQNKSIFILQQQVSFLTLAIKDLQPLKQRIKFLQDQLRKQKITLKDNNSVLQQLQKQKQKLCEQLRLQKPFQEELKQKIAYFERVNLDLRRKMQDYDRRENQYIRQINTFKKTVKKLSDEKADLEDKLFDTSKRLGEKTSQCQALKIQSEGKSVHISNLQRQLQVQKQKVQNLTTQLQATKDFYKAQEKQNASLKVTNKHLMEHQSQYQRVLSHFQKVNDEINLTIIARTEQITKLHKMIEVLQTHSNKLEEKFQKFEILFEDRTQKGDNQIREFFYLHIRQNTKLKLLNKELKTELDEKILKFGQERDTWTKKTTIRATKTPSNEELFGHLYHEKNEQLILLEGSNDQLIKIKKELEQRLRQAQNQLEDQKKQAVALKLKASQVFRAKKQVEQAKKNMDRYQQMIEEQSQSIKDYESQLVVLRQKINILNEKNFMLDLDNKNNLVKIKELQDIMAQINAEVLIQNKTKNDKNAHLINDSLDKLQNGIKSLDFFFSCSFCGQVPPNPITLSPCGHTYCQKDKCKEAYSQFCYECDTGMPIQCKFVNKYMKQAMGKFKFFKIVIEEATSNVKSLLKDI